MRRAVPTADEFNVRTHFDSYNNYLQYVEKKKELISKYKVAKDEVKQLKLQSLEGNSLNKLNSDLGLK